MKNDDNTGEIRDDAYWDLRNFIKKRGRYKNGANGASHTLTDSGHFYSDLLEPMPYVQVQMNILRGMFQGIGRPQDFKSLLRVIDVYLTRVDMDDAHLKKLGWTKFGWDMVPWEVQSYADKFFGVDCRGFVGAYLRDNYPRVTDTKNDMSFYIDGYNKAPASYHIKKGKAWNSFRRIDDPKDVRQGDVLVKCYSGSGSRHVSLVDSVGLADKNGVMITSAESVGGTGLTSRNGRLRRLGSQHKSGANDRNWQHGTTQYNFCLRPRS